MKLKSIAAECDTLIPQLQVLVDGAADTRLIRNHRALSAAIGRVVNIGLAKEFIEKHIVRHSDILQHATSAVRVDLQKFIDFRDAIDGLRWSLVAISGAIKANTSPETQSTIQIKLPSKSVTFRGLSDSIRALDTSLNQLLLRCDETTETRVTGFDNGSLWIEITTAASLIGLVGLIVKAAYATLEMQRKHEMAVLAVQTAKLHQDVIAEMTRGFSAQLQHTTEAHAKALLGDKAVDAEALAQATHTIQVMSELIKDHMEIHPGALATPDAKAAFPSIEEVHRVTNEQSLLTNKSDSPPEA
jgi:hypothetical protein